MKTVERFIGLMSGTSLDGVDAVLVAIEQQQGAVLGAAGSVVTTVEAYTHCPMPIDLKKLLLQCQQGEPITIQALCELDNTLGNWFGDATHTLLNQWGGKPSAITVIGSHGQTVGHYPNRQATCQLGNPAIIASLTCLPVVSHLRQGDMALGGQGAPLVPWVDAMLYSHDTITRYLVNIGGMANVTRVPARFQESAKPVWQWSLHAMDTGPGNVWMDTFCQQWLNEPYDPNGAFAAMGTVNETLLAALLQDAAVAEFLEKPAPKSTGRDVFSVARLNAILAPFLASISPHDGMATLTYFTALTIAKGIQELALQQLPFQQGSHRPTAEIWVTGGGALNPTLMHELKTLLDTDLPYCTLSVGDPLGYPPQYKEPLAFALLAWARWHALPANNPTATGAKMTTPLGAVWLPPAV